MVARCGGSGGCLDDDRRPPARSADPPPGVDGGVVAEPGGDRGGLLHGPLRVAAGGLLLARPSHPGHGRGGRGTRAASSPSAVTLPPTGSPVGRHLDRRAIGRRLDRVDRGRGRGGDGGTGGAGPRSAAAPAGEPLSRRRRGWLTLVDGEPDGPSRRSCCGGGLAHPRRRRAQRIPSQGPGPAEQVRRDRDKHPPATTNRPILRYVGPSGTETLTRPRPRQPWVPVPKPPPNRPPARTRPPRRPAPPHPAPTLRAPHPPSPHRGDPAGNPPHSPGPAGAVPTQPQAGPGREADGPATPHPPTQQRRPIPPQPASANSAPASPEPANSAPAGPAPTTPTPAGPANPGPANPSPRSARIDRPPPRHRAAAILRHVPTDDRPRPQPAPQWTVRPGDDFWSISESTLPPVGAPPDRPGDRPVLARRHCRQPGPPPRPGQPGPALPRGRHRSAEPPAARSPRHAVDPQHDQTPWPCGADPDYDRWYRTPRATLWGWWPRFAAGRRSRRWPLSPRGRESLGRQRRRFSRHRDPRRPGDAWHLGLLQSADGSSHLHPTDVASPSDRPTSAATVPRTAPKSPATTPSPPATAPHQVTPQPVTPQPVDTPPVVTQPYVPVATTAAPTTTSTTIVPIGNRLPAPAVTLPLITRGRTGTSNHCSPSCRESVSRGSRHHGNHVRADPIQTRPSRSPLGRRHDPPGSGSRP